MGYLVTGNEAVGLHPKNERFWNSRATGGFTQTSRSCVARRMAAESPLQTSFTENAERRQRCKSLDRKAKSGEIAAMQRRRFANAVEIKARRHKELSYGSSEDGF